MNIKLARACRIARMLPMAQREILGSIPAELVASLTGKQLGAVMVVLNAHWHKACQWKERDILSEGAIWDGSAQQLREIARPVSDADRPAAIDPAIPAGASATDQRPSHPPDYDRGKKGKRR